MHINDDKDGSLLVFELRKAVANLKNVKVFSPKALSDDDDDEKGLTLSHSQALHSLNYLSFYSLILL